MEMNLSDAGTEPVFGEQKELLVLRHFTALMTPEENALLEQHRKGHEFAVTTKEVKR